MADPAIELIIWMDADRAPLAKQIIEHLKDRVTVLALGGQRQAAVTDLAREYDLPFDDDLRKLMIEHPPAGLLLLSMQDVGLKDLEAAAQSQMMVHSIVPVTSTIAQVSPVTVGCSLLPRFDQSAGWSQAANPLESVGKLDQVHFANLGPQSGASLFARLVDSWELILSMTHLPTVVDAVLSCSGPIPENLEKITGHLSVQGRLSGGGCIQLVLSDCAAMSRRQILLLGHDGQAIITDTHYELYQANGSLIDQWDSQADSPDFAQRVSEGWYNALTNPYAQTVDEASQTKRRKAALGCAHACLISARTGESETPNRVLELQV